MCVAEGSTGNSPIMAGGTAFEPVGPAALESISPETTPASPMSWPGCVVFFFLVPVHVVSSSSSSSVVGQIITIITIITISSVPTLSTLDMTKHNQPCSAWMNDVVVSVEHLWHSDKHWVAVLQYHYGQPCMSCSPYCVLGESRQAQKVPSSVSAPRHVAVD